MQILRIPPYPLSTQYSVPDPSTEYIVIIMDKEKDVVIDQLDITSSANSILVVPLEDPLYKYDDNYYLAIYEKDGDSLGNIVVEDNLEIKRPYVDPSTLGSTATEISEYTKHERLARAIIDSITGGFYFSTNTVDTVGQGTDYVPLTDKVYKILKAYENSGLVYDSSEETPALGSWNYLITDDKTAITKNPVTGSIVFNKSERKPARIPVAQSDSFGIFDTQDSGVVQTIMSGTLFPEGVDYKFVVESGYKVVPYDIKEATLMLIDDIKCGKLDYYKRYITSYSTDQYRLQIDKSALEGTGNILVDKILENYVKSQIRPGVL